MSEQLIAATALAKRWDLKTETLSKWRRLGKGPQGWKYQSKTRVVYPVAEVERYEAGMTAEKPTFSPPSPRKNRGTHQRGCQHPEAKRYSFAQGGVSHVACSSCGESLDPTMSQETMAK